MLAGRGIVMLAGCGIVMLAGRGIATDLHRVDSCLESTTTRKPSFQMHHLDPGITGDMYEHTYIRMTCM